MLIDFKKKNYQGLRFLYGFMFVIVIVCIYNIIEKKNKG